MAGPLKNLPQIQSLIDEPLISLIVTQYSHSETVDALRAIIGALRSSFLADGELSLPDFSSAAFAASVAARVEFARRPSLRAVINATGVIIHTNLGRAPLAPSAIQAMQVTAELPSNLELNLDTGKRGSRHDHVERQICKLTGAQAAVVVNNCAAAVLLSLMATASGRSVIASRGELIEIGGSFRLPDVIAQSGSVLREVGATNRTRLSDYEAAIDETTAVLLKSHTSNFKIVGFTSSPKREELARLAAEKGVILIEDLGSGVLLDLSPYGLQDEPVVSDILKAGVDLVMFSGDKLLGGPQAGIIAGNREIIARLKSHPLMRAVRIDKLSLAALEATLRLYAAPFDPFAQIPVLAMLSEAVADVEGRAQRLVHALAEAQWVQVEVQPSIAHVGAGSVPEQGLPSFAVACHVDGYSAEQVTAKLRAYQTPIIGRIERGRVLFDMRTVRESELSIIVAALHQIQDA
ncbi:L-seryl-tRNA(Ser) seleniumtransferase [Sulfitobacter undariae]|uniref:L-seryl-tRNA(Sec) selenium transferase n=1 Tax=Sulfitobacter undariae TaxID=1563671 RepID=A0A7W6GYC9_9RHOB|nr:L-seryl-tRNA(Sec) selenium transferase [Sulfitobacter undariae]MBB3992761.1 L-seryl-tRNA(Ser) seleniumtransferase [Sulfitobacter undariae]